MVPTVFGLAIVLAWIHVCSAEEPSGFADIEWGTSRAQVIRRVEEVGCKLTLKSKASGGAILCEGYRLIDGLQPVQVSLEFAADDRLIGYAITAQWISLELRQAVVSKFGLPTAAKDWKNPRNSTGSIKRDSNIHNLFLGQNWEGEWEWPSGASAYMIEDEGVNPFGGARKPTTTLSVRSSIQREMDRGRLEQLKKRF